MHSNFLHLHKASVSICQNTYMASPKCLGACIYMYYITLVIIFPCKSILISCACISKVNFIFLTTGHFDWAFTKNHDVFIFLKHQHFLPIWDYGDIIPKNILNAHFVPPHSLSRIFIFNFVDHHFCLNFTRSQIFIVIYIN